MAILLYFFNVWKISGSRFQCLEKTQPIFPMSGKNVSKHWKSAVIRRRQGFGGTSRPR